MVSLLGAGHTGLTKISPRFEAVSDGLGGVTVVWLDGNQKLSVQRLDSSGQQQWGENGIQIAGGVDDRPIIFSGDNQHKIIVGWSANGKSYVQKIDAGGELLWGKNGIELSP